MPSYSPLTNRLWAKIKKARPDDCWLWQAGLNKQGYGTIHSGGPTPRPLLAHRVVYADKVGRIPKEKCVLHRCDVRACCNPKHLFIGTRRDNTDDMMRKKRHRCVPLRGVDNGSAKLTEKQILKIRASKESHRALASCYGVTKTAIGFIKRRKTWKHIG